MSASVGVLRQRSLANRAAEVQPAAARLVRLHVDSDAPLLGSVRGVGGFDEIVCHALQIAPLGHGTHDDRVAILESVFRHNSGCPDWRSVTFASFFGAWDGNS